MATWSFRDLSENLEGQTPSQSLPHHESSGADWKHKLRSEIDKQTQLCHLEDHPPTCSFIGDRQLRKIWEEILLQHASVEPSILEYRDQILDDSSARSLLRIVSILVQIDWPEWKDFASIFIEVSSGRRDRNLPFELQNLTHPEFLNEHYGQLFFESQAAYLGIIIDEDSYETYRAEHHHLPFTLEEKELSKTPLGLVTKVKVARSYLKRNDGSFNDEDDLIVARKRLSKSTIDWNEERRKLGNTKYVAEGQRNLLSHIATVLSSDSFDILFDWTDGDLHNLLYHTDIRDKSNWAQRLLSEFRDLAAAVKFMHEWNSNEKELKSFYVDLKPEHIITKSRFEGDSIGRWIITDFGIGSWSDTPPDRKLLAEIYGGLTQAPEFDKLWEPPIEVITEKADSWALGCIFCLVFASAMGGKDEIHRLEHLREHDSTEEHSSNVFYRVNRDFGEISLNVKPSLSRWLNEVPKGFFATSGISLEVRSSVLLMLSEDPEERRTAAWFLDTLQVISIASQGLAAQGRVASDHLFADDSRERPSLTHSAGRARPPWEETSHLRIHEISQKHTLPDVRELSRGRHPHRIAMCSSGNRMMMCMRDKSILYERHRERGRTMDWSSRILRPCQWVNISGIHHVMLGFETLVPKHTSTTCTRSITTGNTETGEITAGHFATERTIVGSDVSRNGHFALLMRHEIRIRAISSSISMQPYTYRIPDRADHQREGFRAIAFSADGERLVACTKKRWFFWDLSNGSHKPIGNPLVGELDTGRRQPEILASSSSAETPKIIHLTKHPAFLVVHPRSISFHDTASTPSQYSAFPPPSRQSSDILTAIVTPHDTHVLYITTEHSPLRQAAPRYVLRRQALISEEGYTRGSENRSRLTLGTASKECNLDALSYHRHATLAMAFLQEDGECELVVASTTGEVVEARLVYEGGMRAY